MNTPETSSTHSFLAGGGELGALTRMHDWSKSALGSPDQWPASLRTLISMMLHARFPMLIFWGQELITLYNDAFRPLLDDNGKHPSSLGQRGEESWAESWPVIGPMIYNIMAGGDAVWFEDQKLPLYRDSQMGLACWTYSFSPLANDAGVISGVLVTCAETTNTAPEHEALEQSRQKVLALFDQSPVGIAILGADDLVFRMANVFFAELSGRNPDQLVGKSLPEALPELVGQGFDQLLNQVLTTGTPYSAPEVAIPVLRNNQPETIYTDITIQPQRETDGRISGILVVCTDVSQQVLARHEVKATAAKFQSLIEEAPISTCLFVGEDMRIEVVNDVMLSYWGRDKSVIGKPLREALPELEGQPHLQLLQEVFTTGKTYEARNVRADLVVGGQLKTFYFDLIHKPLRNAAGEVYAIMDMSMDVTAQVLARQQVEESEAKLRSVIDASPAAISLLIGPDHVVESCNQAFIDIAGKGPTIIGRPLREIMPELITGNQPFFKILDDVYTSGTAYRTFDTSIDIVQHGVLKRGYYCFSYTPLFDAQGAVYAIVNVALDVTEQVLARQKVEESELRYRTLSTRLEQLVEQRTEELAATNEELSASNEELLASYDEMTTTNDQLNEFNMLLTRSNENLQQFAYIASHDLQEPLRKIQAFGQLLQDQHAETLGPGIDYLKRMQSAANRMSILIQDLLAFSRISTRQDTNAMVPLNEVIRLVLTDLEIMIQETWAQIKIELLPTVLGDAVQLGQLFQNLLSNALKFRQTGVTPIIRVSYDVLIAAKLPTGVKPARLAKSYYRIMVTDNGIGFDQQYADRIFQVFQRLHGKAHYAGTGIGLAICEKVVVNHGGAITASSQPGHGATFCIYLPTASTVTG